MDINHVVLIGRAGSEIELTYSVSGLAIARLSLATSRKWADNEVTTWHKVVAFGEIAESASAITKGDRIAVVGRLETRSYEDNGGMKRYVTEIIAEAIAPAPLRQKNRQDEAAPRNAPSGFNDTSNGVSKSIKPSHGEWIADSPNSDIPF
jgi:single stranded DNA-binding protein